MKFWRIHLKILLLSAFHMKKNWLGFILLFSVLILAACRPVEDSDKPAPSPSPDPLIIETLVTSLPEPTLTPLMERVVLLAPEGALQQDINAIKPVLMKLSEQTGLELETWTNIDQLELAPEIRLVIGLPPDQGMANLASANPETQFLAVGIEPLEPTANLSIVAARNNHPDRQGFLAGYLAAVITPHWRIGVIDMPENPQEKALRHGFNNGVIFYCGLCRPAVPPFVQYPVNISLPMGAGSADHQAAVDQLLANAVQTVYVSAETNDPALLEALASAGINLIGTEPPHESFRSHYIASIQIDLGSAIEDVWPSLLTGEGGQLINPTMKIADITSDLLSPGRKVFVEQMLSDLQDGYIDTGVDPQTGELR
jgi:hypothetical protein